jgi:hypothetical protein
MLVLAMLMQSDAFVDTVVVPVYTSLVVCAIAAFVVGSKGASLQPDRQVVYKGSKKKSAVAVKDTRPWGERFGGVWECSPSRADGFAELVLWQGMPFMKVYLLPCTLLHTTQCLYTRMSS